MMFWDGKVERLLAGERDGEPGHRGVALVADHDVGLALADGPGQPGRPSRSPRLHSACRTGPSPVTSRSEPSLRARHDRQLLLLAGLHQAMFGIDLQADDSRVVVARPGAPLLQPEREQPVGGRVGLHPLAAAVRHGQRGLEQEQAFLGGERRDPPLLGALDDRRVVGLGLEAQQRQLESSLAVLRAVTGPLVAAELGQYAARPRCGS